MRNPHGSSLSVGDKAKKKKNLKLIKLGSRDNRSNEQEPDRPGVVETMKVMTLKPRPEI